MNTPALSFVIPLYNSEGSIAALVQEIEMLEVEGGLEIILVNDGSRDGTAEQGAKLVQGGRVPITLVNHARNFGEHNAVLTGWRHARGDYVVNLDDDGQNPPREAVRLWLHAKEQRLDVVFGHYRTKQHAVWRNLGSWFTNRMTDLALDKPTGFYLSSFRCVSGFVARQVTTHTGPFPYIDGLLLQVTQRIGSLEVEHSARQVGESGYTLRRLIKLWMSAWINFSVLPLRIATVLGLILALGGLVGLGLVTWLRFTHQGPAFGWGSLMAALLIFSGTQLVILGVIGEYIGRMFISINHRPQSVVRDVVTKTGVQASVASD
ncbi:MAG: glycosyltransferase family 2 protein [Cephaloticoccus sp.]|nr:glycosyltransferase family 2 protein [Cephaloticoccus sp.]